MNTKPLSLLRNPDLFSKLFLVLFCVAWFVFFHWKSLTNDLVINDDNAQHVAWMWQWKANNFQANDPMNLAAETLQQWGYLAVARVAMLVMTPIQFSKYMPLATLLVTCFFTYFLFKKRFGNAIGITAAVLLGFLTMERMTGFNGRAFAFPLLLGFLFYFTERRWAGTAILLVMSALFYPIVLLIELGMLGLEAAYQVFTLRKNGWQQLRSHRKTWLMLSTVVLLSVAIPAIKSRQIANHPLLGHAYSKQELLSLTVFGEDGRVDFAHEMKPLGKVLQSSFSDKNFFLPMLLVALALLLAASIQEPRHRSLDRAILFIPLAGITLLLAARFSMLSLFLPSRYLTYTYPVFFAFLLARLLGIQATIFQKKWWLGFLLVGSMIASKAFLSEPTGRAQVDYSNFAWLFKKLNELPDDRGLIAGPPLACDMIPMVCQRSVLFSFEGAHAVYFKNYWGWLEPRMMDYIDAITSPDVAVVEAFVKKYGVKYLIVDRGFSEKGHRMHFFEPMAAYLAERKALNPDADFAVTKLPKEFYFPVEQSYLILDCGKWLDR